MVTVGKGDFTVVGRRTIASSGSRCVSITTGSPLERRRNKKEEEKARRGSGGPIERRPANRPFSLSVRVRDSRRGLLALETKSTSRRSLFGSRTRITSKPKEGHCLVTNMHLPRNMMNRGSNQLCVACETILENREHD